MRGGPDRGSPAPLRLRPPSVAPAACPPPRRASRAPARRGRAIADARPRAGLPGDDEPALVDRESDEAAVRGLARGSPGAPRPCFRSPTRSTSRDATFARRFSRVADAVARNVHRGESDVALFEIGRVFDRGGGPRRPGSESRGASPSRSSGDARAHWSEPAASAGKISSTRRPRRAPARRGRTPGNSPGSRVRRRGVRRGRGGRLRNAGRRDLESWASRAERRRGSSPRTSSPASSGSKRSRPRPPRGSNRTLPIRRSKPTSPSRRKRRGPGTRSRFSSPARSSPTSNPSASWTATRGPKVGEGRVKTTIRPAFRSRTSRAGGRQPRSAETR